MSLVFMILLVSETSTGCHKNNVKLSAMAEIKTVNDCTVVSQMLLHLCYINPKTHSMLKWQILCTFYSSVVFTNVYQIAFCAGLLACEYHPLWLNGYQQFPGLVSLSACTNFLKRQKVNSVFYNLWLLTEFTSNGAWTSNVTSIIDIRSASARLFAGMWRPLVSVIISLYYVAIIYHCQVWYRVLCVCYACIWCSGIILIP